MYIDTQPYPPIDKESLEETMFLALKDGETLFFPHGDTGASVGLMALTKKMRRAAEKAKGRCRVKKEPDGIRFWLLR